jgi:hypothetical protein
MRPAAVRRRAHELRVAGLHERRRRERQTRRRRSAGDAFPRLAINHECARIRCSRTGSGRRRRCTARVPARSASPRGKTAPPRRASRWRRRSAFAEAPARSRRSSRAVFAPANGGGLGFAAAPVSPTGHHSGLPIADSVLWTAADRDRCGAVLELRVSRGSESHAATRPAHHLHAIGSGTRGALGGPSDHSAGRTRGARRRAA